MSPRRLEQLPGDQRREPERRLVEQQQPRVADISARAMASICCSPPLIAPGGLAAPFAEPREDARTSGRCRR